MNKCRAKCKLVIIAGTYLKQYPYYSTTQQVLADCYTTSGMHYIKFMKYLPFLYKLFFIILQVLIKILFYISKNFMNYTLTILNRKFHIIIK